MKCDVCDGQGTLARGGFHKRNPVAIARIVGRWSLQSPDSFNIGWQSYMSFKPKCCRLL